MKKPLLILLLVLSFTTAFAFEMNLIRGKDFDSFNCAQFEQDIIPHCEKTKNFIRGCYANPNNCDCSQFSEPEAVEECNKWVNEGIKLMNEKSQECMNDLYACSCNDLPHPRLVSACQSEKDKFVGKLRALEQSCFTDPATCTCSVFENPEYIAKCEEELNKAKQIADTCAQDIQSCDCSQITNPVGRAKCEENKAFYMNYEENFRKDCEEDFENCDCSKIPNIAGQNACEAQKLAAVTNAESQVYAMLYNCFKDVNNCDCSKLQNQGYIDYCEETKNYGFACMQTGGLGCEQLDNLVLYPPGLPEFLRPFFSRTFKAFIEEEKLKGMTASAEAAKNCVIDPEGCDCNNIPVYARDFCLEKKEMQIDCITGNITACEVLDKTIEVVPRTAPEFVRNFLDPLLRPLMLMQKEQIKGRYAEQVKEQMLLCVNDENSCDCSTVPLQYREFCNNKITLVKECKAFDYDSCFRLMDEPNIPDDLPGFIRIFVQGAVEREVSQKINEELKRNVDSIKEPIISCIINEEECDCSTVPLQYREFCENKVLSVRECKAFDYDTCFRLMDEEIIPEDLPERLKEMIRAPIEREFEQSMNRAFEQIKPEPCKNMNLAQCVRYYNTNCRGMGPNECLKQ